MYELPTEIQVGKQSYPIRNQGDYRIVLDCFVALNDIELSMEERVYASLIIFYDNMNDIMDIHNNFPDIEEAIKQMYNFFNCNEPDPGVNIKLPRLIDWEKDSQLIASAVNKVSGQEIRTLPYMHWWTFMGYYIAIGESPLAHIVSIRHKIATHQKLEKYERKFQAENPQYFRMDFRTDEDKEYDELIKSIWNKED